LLACRSLPGGASRGTRRGKKTKKKAQHLRLRRIHQRRRVEETDLGSGRNLAFYQPPRYETNPTEDFCALQDWAGGWAMDFLIKRSHNVYEFLTEFSLSNQIDAI
jgi:hypothetical protein